MTTQPKSSATAIKHLAPTDVLHRQNALQEHFRAIGGNLLASTHPLTLTPANPKVDGRASLQFTGEWKIEKNPPEAIWGGQGEATVEITLEDLIPNSAHGLAFTVAAEPDPGAGSGITLPNDVVPPPARPLYAAFENLPPNPDAPSTTYPGLLVKAEAGVIPPPPNILFDGELVAGGAIFPFQDDPLNQKFVLLTVLQLHDSEFVALTVMPVMLKQFRLFSFSTYDATLN
jgi:hypothetical protein